MNNLDFIKYVFGHISSYQEWKKVECFVVEDYKEDYVGLFNNVLTKINVTYFKDKLRVAIINDVFPFVFSWKDGEFIRTVLPYGETQVFKDLEVLLTKAIKENINVQQRYLQGNGGI